MALNISKLTQMSEFSMELDSLGRIDCLSLTTENLSQANKMLNSPSTQSQNLVRWLLGEIARHANESHANKDDPITGASLSPEELSSVTEGRLEEFADNLIQKNRYLLNTHKGRSIERSPDESACDFLVRAFRHYATEQKEARKRLTEPLSKSLFARSTMEAMQLNHGLSNQLQDTINKYACGHSGIEQMLAEERSKWEHMTKSISQAFSASAGIEAQQRNHEALDQLQDQTEKDSTFDFPNSAKNCAKPSVEILNTRISMPPIQRNPIHETNEKLESVVKQIEDLRPMAAQAAQLICSMNDTALRMQTDYLDNARSSGTQTKIAIGIAVVSLIVSSFFSYQTYVDSKETGEKDAAQIKAFQKEIRDLVAAQRDDRAAIVMAIMEAPDKHAKNHKPVTSPTSSSSPH